MMYKNFVGEPSMDIMPVQTKTSGSKGTQWGGGLPSGGSDFVGSDGLIIGDDLPLVFGEGDIPIISDGGPWG